MLATKPPPPVGAGGGYMFSGRPSVPPSVRVSVIRVVVLCFRDISSICWLDFRQTFVTGASWDIDDLITFLGQKVKGQGHTIAAEVHSTRRYRRVQLFLVFLYSWLSFFYLWFCSKFSLQYYLAESAYTSSAKLWY